MNTKSPFRRSKSACCKWVVAVLSVMLLPVSWTSAQIIPKPPPPTVGGGGSAAQSNPAMPVVKPPPVTATDAINAQLKPPPAEVLAQFRDAYAAAGRPKILMMVGIARTGLPEVGQGGGASGIARGGGVGADISSNDSTGIAGMLRTQIGKVLASTGVTLVDLSALEERDARDIAAMAQNDNEAAVDTMARKVNARYVLYLKMTPTNAQTRGQNKYKYACIVELKDVSEATGRPIDSFNWDGDLDNTRAQIYGNALAEDLCKNFADLVKMATGLRDMTVTFMSLPNASAERSIRRAIEKVEGVDPDSVESSVQASTESGTNATVTLRYKGRSQRLSDDIVDAVQPLGLQVEEKQREASRIIFAAAGESSAGPDWYLITDGKDNAIRTAFKQAYAKNPLKVAVVVNWMVTPQEMNWIEQLRHPIVITQGDSRIDNKMLGTQTVGLENAESEIMEQFRQLGVVLVDPSEVGKIAQREGNKAADIQNDTTLETILKNDTGYDLLCMGVASTSGRLDFKIVNRQNARFMGFVTWPVSDLRLEQDRATQRKLESAGKSTNDVKKGAISSRYIAGNLLIALQQAVGSNISLTVTLRHAPDLATARTLADLLNGIVEVNTGSVRLDNTLGSFDAKYSGSFQDLEERIRVKLEKNQAYKVIELNPSWMSIDYAR